MFLPIIRSINIEHSGHDIVHIRSLMYRLSPRGLFEPLIRSFLMQIVIKLRCAQHVGLAAIFCQPCLMDPTDSVIGEMLRWLFE